MMILWSKQVLSKAIGVLTFVVVGATFVPSVEAQFDSYEGTFLQAKSGTVEISTPDGVKSFRMAKPNEILPEMPDGQGTSVSVQGIDNVSFLKPKMLVKFEAEQDKNNNSIVPIEELEVIASNSKTETSKQLIAEIDAATGNSFYRFISRVEHIDLDKSQLAVIVREGQKSDRFVFLIDTEKTRVKFNFTDLKLARPGDSIVVRCLPPRNGMSFATEVRVTRPSPFPEDPVAQADVVQQGQPAIDGNDQPDMLAEVDPNNGDMAADDAIPNQAARDEDFDDPPRRKKIKGRRWYKIN